MLFSRPCSSLLDRSIHAGNRSVPLPKEQELEDLVGDLSERFQRTSSQLGVAKESEVRELLRQLSGKVVDGKLMGQKDTVVIPRFAQVSSYLSTDGQIEFDALGEIAQETASGNYNNWIVELNWRKSVWGERIWSR